MGLVPIRPLDNIKILIAASITVSLIIILTFFTSPPSLYEFSIYQGLNSMIWLLIILVFIMIFIVFLSNPTSKEWAYGLTIAGLMGIMTVVIPYLRGYYRFFTGDTLTHIGVMKTIVQNNSFPSSPFEMYPSIHLLGASMSKITDLGVDETVILLLVMINISSLLIGVAMARKLPISRSGKVFTSGLIAILHIGFYNISPWAVGRMLFIFLIVWLVFSVPFTTKSQSVVSVLILGSIVPFHPLIGVVLLILFGIALFEWVISLPHLGSDRHSPDTIWSLAVFLSVILITWLINTTRFGTILVGDLVAILMRDDPRSPSPAGGVFSAISGVDVELFDIATIFSFRYGFSVIIIGLALLLIVFAHYHRAPMHPTYRRWIVYPVVAFWLLGTIAFFSPIPGFNIGRFYQVSVLFATIVIGVEGAILLNKNPRYSRIAVAVLIIAMVVIIPLSVATTYNSQGNAISNDQILKSELTTTDWVQNHTDADILYSRSLNLHRLGVYRAGLEGHLPHQSPPPHFDWENNPGYEKSGYLIINSHGREALATYYPNYEEHWDYTPDDFTKLNDRADLNKVYSTGDVDLYRLQQI